MAGELRGRALIGQRFGNYVIEALIGAGGMGAVYRAVQPEIGKLVAIKFLSAALSAQPELVQRFFAEARAVNLIQHDNIVDIFDFGNVDETSWFVMELLRGRSITAALALEARLSMGRTVDICVQIADAIAAAHGRGIIHRDLKGDNVFLVTHGGREDFVKILDFGIAKLSDPSSLGVGSHTRTGAILGTPGYMSPEQGTGGTVDGRTDIYALGVIAYRMLAGRLPHEGINHLEIVQKQLTQEPVPLQKLRPDAPPALAALVQQMLSRQADARPQKMLEVRDRLRALAHEAARAPARDFPVVDDLPTAPTPTTLSSAHGQVATDPDPSRRRVGLWAGLGGLVVAGGAAAYLGLRPAPAPPADAPRLVTAPAIVVASKPVAAAAPKVRSGFECLVETDPPGAQVLLHGGGSPIGVTPATLKLKDDPTTITLRLNGYGEEDLEVGHDTEHAIIRLHKVMLPPPRPRPNNPAPVALPKPPPTPKKPSFGLDD